MRIYTKGCVAHADEDFNAKERLLVRYFCLFAANSGMRSGEQHNLHWRCVSTHKDRDFGVETAINTLRYVRQLQTFYFNKRRVVGALVDDNIEALKQVDGLI